MHGVLTGSQTLYIFFGIAALVGIVTGMSLHYVSAFIISILSLESPPEKPRGRTLASYRAEKQKRWNVNHSVMKLRQIDGGPKRNEFHSEEDCTNKGSAKPNRRPGGSRFNTILEEEDSSDGFRF